MDAVGWHRALAFALTGVELPLGLQDRPDTEALLRELRSSGWSPESLADHARRRLAASETWPHPIPDALRRGLGAAQLLAALGEVRAALNVSVLEERGPSRRSALTADERRLLADVPPHHVR
nr:hypothetical protein [Propionibacterium sp.]